ncbi:MAG: hypothetical protein AAF488_10085 [Planctomycetota bacterium]
MLETLATSEFCRERKCGSVVNRSVLRSAVWVAIVWVVGPGCYRRDFGVLRHDLETVRTTVHASLAEEGLEVVDEKQDGNKVVTTSRIETFRDLPGADLEITIASRPDGTSTVQMFATSRLHWWGFWWSAEPHATEVATPFAQRLASDLAELRQRAPKPGAIVPEAGEGEVASLGGVTRYLLIAVAQHRRAPLETQRNAVADVDRLQAQLLAAGVPAAEVTVLKDREAESSDLRSALHRLATDAEPGDTIVVCFMGYSVNASPTRTYFVPYDGNMENPHGTMVTPSDLDAAWSRSRASRQCVILDTRSVEGRPSVKALSAWGSDSRAVVATVSTESATSTGLTDALVAAVDAGQPWLGSRLLEALPTDANVVRVESGAPLEVEAP